MKKITMIILLVGLFLAGIGASYGCVGSRPLAMGGAFIGLADDANTTYWNPAGLAQMDSGGTMGTWMHTSNNRDEINYQDFASLSACAQMPRLGKLAFGASYIREDTALLLGGLRAVNSQNWVWASLAYDAGKFGMVGLNVRKIDDSLPGYSASTETGLDVGYLYRIDSKLSVGMLVQDINEPETTITGVGAFNRIQNWRVGLAYRYRPDIVVTFDGYDLADNGGACSARFGVEKKFGSMALRGGYYGLGGDMDAGPTLGIGMEDRTLSFDAAIMMGDFDNTIMLSGTYKAF